MIHGYAALVVWAYSLQNDLDSRFGRIGRRAGNHVRHFERKFKPLSLFILGRDSRQVIEDLRKLSDLTEIAVLSRGIRLLWAVSREGEIHVAFGELVDPNLGSIGQTFQPSMNLPTGLNKLGHPSLIDDNEARISGELYLDDGVWVINNKSGRFGFLEDRSEVHLSNVAAEFVKHGLKVEIDFLAPR